mgnify:CR=1 FL=1
MVTLDVLEVRGGWLICRQPNGYLCGIIWSDGSYYADLLEDPHGEPLTEEIPGMRVRGTVRINPDDPDDLGAIL